MQLMWMEEAEGTYNELMRALSGKPIITIAEQKPQRLDTEEKFGSVILQARETAKELLNQPPVTTQVKRETRKLANNDEVNLLPPDLYKKKDIFEIKL